MRVSPLAALTGLAVLTSCQAEGPDFGPSGISSGGGAGQGAVGTGSGQGDGGQGDEPPAAEEDDTTTGADIVGSDLTLWTETDTQRFEVTLHLDGLQLPRSFEVGDEPDAREHLEGRATEVGPPIAVFDAERGGVDLTTCPGAVGDRAKGAWADLQFEQVDGSGARRLHGAFDYRVGVATDVDIACEAGAPSEGEGEGEGEGEIEPPQECSLRADDLCTPGARGPCCPLRQQVENCHEECSFGVCLNPRAAICLPCLEGCIQNIVDADCLDRYISLSRCEFASGCVGANDPALTCTIGECCDELNAALAEP